MGTYAPDLQTLSLGLLIARVVIGLLMAAHGAQKLLGWFGGYGLKTTGELFAQLGFQPRRFFAAPSATSQIAGGLLLAPGFLRPLAPEPMLFFVILAGPTGQL